MKRNILNKMAVLFMGAMMLASNATVFASENSNVEIRLNLGSPELYINSQSVTVPAPFSAGAGTTMVPLRVISEAFGAEVNWDSASKGITIKYDNSEMKMYVNNTEAIVNGASEQLPSAPVVVNGTTMVPLRFISEKLGAEVSFDAQTKSVVVKKSAQKADTASTDIDVNELLQVKNQEFVGDSHYKWYMKNSSTFSLEERNFDGTELSYSDDDGMNYIDISIDNTLSSSYTIDEAIAREKRYGSSYTMVSQNQSSQDGAECYEVKYKTKDKEIYTKLMVKDGILYDFTAYISTDDENKNKDVALDLFNSIKLGSPKADSISDISSLSESGMRKFEENDLKISMELPTSWSLDSENSNVLNKFYFSEASNADNDDESAEISIFMYSREDNLSLENWAKRDAQSLKDTYNPKYYSQKMTSGKLGSYDYCGYEEDVKIDDTTYKKLNYYIYGDEYRYQITAIMPVSVTKDKEKYDEIKKCLNSFKFSTPDKNKVGTLYENYTNNSEEDKKTKEVTDSEKHITTKIPVAWSNSYDSIYIGNEIPVILDLTSMDFALTANEFGKQFNQNNKYKLIEQKPVTSVFGGKSGTYFKYQTSSEDSYIYEIYLVNSGNKTSVISFFYPDIYNGTRLRNNINDIIANTRIK